MTEQMSFAPDAGDSHEPTVRGQIELLRRSEETFSLLVDSVKDYAIFMLDPRGNVATWNKGAERIKGYKADEIIGRHFSTFYTDEAQESRHPQHELEIAMAVGTYEEEGIRVRKDGSTFWADVVITRIDDKQGNHVGFAKVTRDLTERKHVEMLREEAAKAISEKNAQLQATADQLQQSNEELQHLAYIISHELQAPINTITRYCNLLNVRYRDRLGQDANDFMSKMTTGANLISRMIDDLWTYARVTKPVHEVSSVNTRHALKDALSEIRDKIDDDELVIGDLPTIEGHRQQLTHVFKELISNAVQYRGSSPPHVEIDSVKENDGWRFTVKDNGVGIDPVHANEVFRMFHRLGTGPEASATGMGLATCKKIIEHHGGQIWFESAGPGTGTTFYFWLPERHQH